MLPDVQRVADQVLVLDKGRLRGSFRLEDLHAATGRWDLEGEGDPAGFDAALTARGVAVEAAPGAEAAGAEPASSNRFRRVARIPPPEGPARVLAAAHETRTTLRMVTPRSESLDDVFHRLLGEAPPPPGSAQ
jgi:hypothetical protein